MATEAICSVEGCDKAVRARGWCATHYARWARAGGLGRKCSVETCGDPAVYRQWCSAHYLRWTRNGSLGDALLKAKPKARKEWLLRAIATESEECIIWPFPRLANGYALVTIEGKARLIHRYVCEVANGPPEEKDLQAAHSCGAGRMGCINPRHLRWATATENSHDKIAHGTRPLGEASGSAVITAIQAAEIYSRKGRATGAQVARDLNTNRHVVHRIWKGLTWAWLTGERRRVSS